MSNRNHPLEGSSIRLSSLYCFKECHRTCRCLNLTVEECSVRMLGMSHHHTFQSRFGISIAIEHRPERLYFSKAISMLALKFLFVLHSFHLLPNILYFISLIPLAKIKSAFAIYCFQTFLN